MTEIKALICLASVLVLGVLCACSSQECFNGSRVKNPDAYLLDIEKMNGTDLHTMELQEGDTLRIRFETLNGSLYMEIKSPDGSTVYQGNGKSATDFTVNINKSGVYSVVVEAKHAKGTIHIRVSTVDKKSGTKPENQI